MREKIFRLTPLGRADIELKEYLGKTREYLDTEEFQEYEKARQSYRELKLMQTVVKILLYAGLITSVIASLGFEQIKILNQIASYIGVTFLIILYLIVNYATMLQREEYHVKREILVSHTQIKAEEDEKDVEENSGDKKD
jgi:amino acid permease